MTTYQEAVYRDANRDGVWDVRTVTWNVFDSSGLLDYTTIDTDHGNDGVVDLRESTYLTYTDPGGLLSSEVYEHDQYADGLVEWGTTRTLTYDTSGRVIVDRLDSADLIDQDGNSDYSQETTTTYDSSGRVSQLETEFYFNNVGNGIDYRLETFTYNAKGLLYEHFTDDTSLYDFPVGFRHTYNSSGQIVKTQMQNEYEFGDQNWRTEDTYKYSGGRLVETNAYGEWFNGTHVLEIKNKLSYTSDGLVSKEVTTGQNNAWQTVERMQIEHWYANGEETAKLTSFDENLDGVFDAGTRTLERWAYNDDGFGFTHTVDYNSGDGVIEEQYTSELLVA